MTTHLEAGIEAVQRGDFALADTLFEAELNHSNKPNVKVLKHHGILLLKMGKYLDAMIKFDNYLANHPNDRVCLLGKKIALELLNQE